MIRKSKEMARTPEIINDLAFHASQVLIESINLDSSSAENVGFAIADRMMRNWADKAFISLRGSPDEHRSVTTKSIASAMGATTPN
ncbi:putative transcriptional regulator [Escherichia coli]|uniref:Putative transcriptional regulator n=1 Tax=Escherichia coli TaxID=562 RepID=A0A377B6Y0_ECOLX|nr:putative transcriptional regulator [Escherichia coli]